MGFPGLDIQRAVYATLTGDTTLMNLITGVYDSVPDKKGFDFVVIGDDKFEAFDSHTTNGQSGELQIHVWSRGRGRASAHVILENIYRLLHENIFPITGYSVIAMRWETSQIVVEQDGVTYHGISRFKILIGET